MTLYAPEKCNAETTYRVGHPSHRCFNRAAKNVNGKGYCRVHASILNRKEMTMTTDRGVTLAEHISVLEALYGGLRQTAKAIKIDVGYLSRLKTTHNIHPSERTLHKLGLRHVATFYMITTVPKKAIKKEATQ